MKKLLVRVVMAMVVLVIVVGVVGYFWLDVIAKEAVQRGGTYAMDVKTTVDSVSLKPFDGKLQMKGLKVANPTGMGFANPYLIDMKSFDLGLVPGSLMEDTIMINKSELDGLGMSIEQKLPKSNISVIMDNVKKMLGGDKSKEEKASKGKKYKVGELTIRNVVVHVKVLVGPELTIKVPPIEMKNIAGEDGGGVTMPELVSKILLAIMAGVVEQGKGVLPADLLNGLQGDIAAVTAQLGGQAQEMVRGVQSQVGNALKGILPVDANSVGGQLNKTIGGTVGKLLGGGSKDANQDANKPKAPGLLDGILGGKKK